MKIKPTSRKGKVLVELGSKDEGLLQPLPFKLRRILVAVDFSETAKKALRYAVPFATTFDAEVMLLHVMQPFSMPAELGYIPSNLAISDLELMKSAREGLDKLGATEIGARARYKLEVREGVPWQEIVTSARETETDLIILSTHGRTGLTHALLGSVAERVMRHAPCPVLVVREREWDFVPTPQQPPASRGETEI